MTVVIDEASKLTQTKRPYTWPQVRRFSHSEFVFESNKPSASVTFSHKIGKADITLRYEKCLSFTCESEKFLRCIVEIGLHDFEIYVCADTVQAFIIANGSPQDFGSLSDTMSCLLLEHLLFPHCAILEQQLGGQLTICGVHEAERPDPEATFVITCEGLAVSPTSIMIAMDLDTLAQVKAAVFTEVQSSTKSLRDTISHSISFFTPPFLVHQKDILSLQPGNAFLLDSSVSGIRISRAVLDCGSSVQVRFAREKITPVGPFQARASNEKLGKTNMSKSEDFEVEIAVEIARKRYSIDQIDKFRAGAVLPLEKNLGNTVRLLSDNCTIAEGELIEVDGLACVQIIKVY